MIPFKKSREYVLKVYIEWNYDRAVKMIQKLNHEGVISLEDRSQLMEMLVSLENGKRKRTKKVII